jgi:hypothetical protein
MSLDIYLELDGEQVYGANVTHNLGKMAGEVDFGDGTLYGVLWRSDIAGSMIERAADLIQPLRLSIQTMLKEPERFKLHNPKNGWGSYDRFIPWLQRLHLACIEFPNATVRISR